MEAVTMETVVNQTMEAVVGQTMEALVSPRRRAVVVTSWGPSDYVLNDFTTEFEAGRCWRRRGRVPAVMFIAKDKCMVVRRRWGSESAIRRILAWYHAKLQGAPKEDRWWDEPKIQRVVDAADDRQIVLFIENDVISRQRFPTLPEARTCLRDAIAKQPDIAAVLFLQDTDVHDGLDDDDDENIDDGLRQVVEVYGSPRRVEALKRCSAEDDVVEVEQFSDDETIDGALVVPAEPVPSAITKITTTTTEKKPRYQPPSLRELAACYEDEPKGDDETKEEGELNLQGNPVAVFVRVTGLDAFPESWDSIRRSLSVRVVAASPDELESSKKSGDVGLVAALVVPETVQRAKVVVAVHDDDRIDAYAAVPVSSSRFRGALDLVDEDGLNIGTAVHVTMCAVPIDAALAALLSARPSAVVTVEQRIPAAAPQLLGISLAGLFANCGCGDPANNGSWNLRGYYAPDDGAPLASDHVPLKKLHADASFDELAPLEPGERVLTTWRCVDSNDQWQYAMNLHCSNWHAPADPADTVRRCCWTRLVTDDDASQKLDQGRLANVLDAATFFDATNPESFGLDADDRNRILAAWCTFKSQLLRASRDSLRWSSSTIVASPYRRQGDFIDVPSDVENPRNLLV